MAERLPRSRLAESWRDPKGCPLQLPKLICFCLPQDPGTWCLSSVRHARLPAHLPYLENHPHKLSHNLLWVIFSVPQFKETLAPRLCVLRLY